MNNHLTDALCTVHKLYTQQPLRHLLLVLSLVLAQTVWAAQFTYQGIQYITLDDQTCSVGNNQNCTIADIVIPETVEYNGKSYTVTQVGPNAFYNNQYLKTITLPSTVNNIDGTTFNNCSNLTSAFLPGVQRIGYATFQYCSSLTTIYFPNLQRIGGNAFYNCTSLTDIILPPSTTFIGAAVFNHCPNLKTITCLAATPPETDDGISDGNAAYDLALIYPDHATGYTNWESGFATRIAAKSLNLTDEINNENIIIYNLENDPYYILNIHRPIRANQWTTLILPYDMSDAALRAAFGADYKLAKITAADLSNNGSRINIKTESTHTLQKNVLYLLWSTKDVTDLPTTVKKKSEIVGLSTEGNDIINGNVFISGIYESSINKGEISRNFDIYYLANDNVIKKLSINGYMKPFRVYFGIGKNNATDAHEMRITLDGQDMNISTISTGITITENAPTIEKQHSVYDLQGRKVAETTDNLLPGLYIVNGRKVAIH